VIDSNRAAKRIRHLDFSNTGASGSHSGAGEARAAAQAMARQSRSRWQSFGMDDLMRFPAARRRDPDVAAWFAATDPQRQLVEPWFEQLRDCGEDVCELMHDCAPTACVGDAAFAYVAAYRAHAAIGFFEGASLPDPAGLLEGSGKRMRHFKLRWGAAIDEDAVAALIAAAYADMRHRTGAA
jgi:hypothetical protein